MINEYLFHTKNQVSIENMMTESGDSVAEWLGTPACHRSSGIAMAPGSDEGDVHILDMTSLKIDSDMTSELALEIFAIMLHSYKNAN